MDIVRAYVDDEIVDKHLLGEGAPPEWFQKGGYLRDFVVLFWIQIVGAYLLYFFFTTTSYYIFFVWFKDTFNPTYKYNGKEIRNEIVTSCKAVPWLAIMTAPLWMIDEKLTYKNVADYGVGYLLFSVVWFLVFTDFLIYWFHRWLHYPPLYRVLHATHHSFVSITPFASHAFHPVDGYIQALPYHLFVLFFPMHNITQFCLFIFVNFWTISIHDRVRMERGGVINGAAHHTLHHRYFKCNYGQYFTLWDRVGNTYLEPGDKPSWSYKTLKEEAHRRNGFAQDKQD
ncbi:Fatty acid hydroxylase domain-containing protein [Balamuthia mandrillaris]